MVAVDAVACMIKEECAAAESGGTAFATFGSKESTTDRRLIVIAADKITHILDLERQGTSSGGIGSTVLGARRAASLLSELTCLTERKIT
jgi:hypothetical protein